MKNVAPVRKELGVKTIFNILGPLTNPAGAPNILMGVFHPDLVGIQVRALQRLGAEHAVVVYGRDGMDEISLGAATLVGELRNGEMTEYEIHPEDFGLADGQQPRAARWNAGAVSAPCCWRCLRQAWSSARHRAAECWRWRCTRQAWRFDHRGYRPGARGGVFGCGQGEGGAVGAATRPTRRPERKITPCRTS
ncbi:MAG: hypothetical protein QM755_00055 [Luteolibacter sp.]